MRKIERALISVYDKAGVVELARTLKDLDVEILSTSGTAKLLRERGIAVTDVSQVTGFPETMDGRVKTLHPAIHAGILARRDKPEDMEALARQGIQAIDLVVINLYPFEQVVKRPDVSLEEAVESIDIGGPAMIRASAKNWEGVAVVVDPSQYAPILAELRHSGGSLGRDTRYQLAREAFARTAAYDRAVAGYLARCETAATEPFPARLTLSLEKISDLRYGENPHQRAAFYRLPDVPGVSLARARQLHGPELSYNNILDLNAVLNLVLEFDDPACVVIKHTNPCGAALGANPTEAFEKAKASDPVSIYGGVVGFNRPVDLAVVERLSGLLLEILFAPAFQPDALPKLKEKKKLRVIELPMEPPKAAPGLREYRSVRGGLLAQEPDLTDLEEVALKVVTRRIPTDAEMRALRFAWRVAKHVKSNAIVLATADQLIGVGAGQMSRVDSARFAVERARTHGFDTRGTVVASDAFFPFRDGLDLCARAGATAVIQPGGSIRDAEVIAAADEAGMAMLFTGIRHFRH